MNARMEDIKEEGIKKGKLEGKLEGIITVAKEMLKRKVSINDISLYTGLSKQEIEKTRFNL